MATANKAITGVGSVIGRVSRYSDWLGNTLDAKIEELIPGITIPGATYDHALDPRRDGGGGVAAALVGGRASRAVERLPEGDASPGGWSDWSWHQEEGSSKSK